MDLIRIGQTLKEKRTKLGMSIRDLANICQIAPSTISLIENGKTSPSLLSLKSICDTLNVPVFSLLLDEAEDKIKLVRKSEQSSFIRNVSNGQPMTEHLIIHGVNEMYAALVHVPPHTDSGKYVHHGGEEFVFILNGTIVFDLECKARYVLDEHDTLYYPNCIGHRWENNTDMEAEIMLVSTSPYKF